MPNMSNVKVEMPSQEPEIRATNFKEVTLGYRNGSGRSSTLLKL